MLVGLAVSAAVLAVGELALLLMLLAVFAAIPLALGFFVAFALSSMVRNLKRRAP